MPEPTIDPAAFRALGELAGADFANELIDTFLEEAPRMLADLRDAHERGDATRFRRAAHSLKSNSDTFGATRLGAAARDLEHGGLEATTRSALDALDAEYAVASAALKALRDG